MASARKALRIEAASAWKTGWTASTHENSLRRLWKEPSKAPMQLKAYGEPLHQSSFKCKLGRLRWPVILVPLMLWNRLNALVDAAFKIHAIFSSTVQTRQDPGCAILCRVKVGAGLPGLPKTA